MVEIEDVVVQRCIHGSESASKLVREVHLGVFEVLFAGEPYNHLLQRPDALSKHLPVLVEPIVQVDDYAKQRYRKDNQGW